MNTLLMILLVLLLVGSLPTWPYSSGWGYYPAGGLGVILLVTVVLLLFSGRTVCGPASGEDGGQPGNPPPSPAIKKALRTIS